MAATSVLKLKVEDKEYNASLRQAQQGMQHLGQALQSAGKTFKQVDKSVVEFARGIGQMEAQSKTARGRIGEMSSAFIELSTQYKKMSDDVKSSDVGKALAESMEQLKKRTIDAKAELEGLNKELNNVKMPEVKEGGQFGGGSNFEDALSVFAGNMATKATGALMELGNEVLNITKESMQLAAQAEGIETAFARLNNPGLLDGLRAATHGTVSDLDLMKAAVKFNDFKLPVEELGTMLAFAQQKAKDTGQSVDYMVDSIVTGLGRKSVMILDNLGLSASEIKERMKETGDMTTAVGAIIRDQMAEAGDYVETAADRTTTSAVAMQNAMLEFGKTMQQATGISSWDELNNYLKADLIKTLNDVVTGAMKVGSTITEAVNGVIQVFKPMVTTINGAKDAATSFGIAGTTALEGIKSVALSALGPVGNLVDLFRQIGKGVSTSDDVFKAVGDKANEKINGYRDRMLGGVKRLFGGGKNSNTTPAVTTTPKPRKTGGKTTGTHTGSNTPKVEMTEEQKLQKQINDLVQQGLGMDEQSRTLQREKIAALQEQLQTIKDIKDELLGIDNMPAKGKIDEVVVKASPEMQMRNKRKTFSEDGLSEKSLSTFISGVKSVLSGTDIGSEIYESIKAQLADATGMQEVLQAAMDAGISGIELDGIGTKMKEALLDGDIPEDMFNNVLEQINKLREEAGKEPVTIDFETGNLKEVKKETIGVKDAMIVAGQSINQVAGALEGIEDPGVKAAAIVAEAIANIALGFAIASKDKSTAGTGWGWLAWLAAGGAALATTISTVHSLTGFAGGGVVEGNSYSGDNQLVRVNAGETILTRAQSGVIADALEGSAMSNLKLETYVSGKRLRIVMNNDSMARGQGKLVSSNTLRG